MKFILLASALLLSPDQVARLDQAWLICQHSVERIENLGPECPDCFDRGIEWPKDGYPQCQAVYEAQRERAVIRENAKKLETERKQKKVSNFLDSVLDMLK